MQLGSHSGDGGIAAVSPRCAFQASQTIKTRLDRIGIGLFQFTREHEVAQR